MKNKCLKVFTLILLIGIMFVAGGLLTACGHEHEWIYLPIEGEIHTHLRACKGCDEQYKEECTIIVVDHRNATCEQDGATVHQCAVCGNSHEHNEEKKLGHHYLEDGWQPLYVDDDPSDAHAGEYQKKHFRVCSRDNTHIEEDECEFDAGVIVPPTCDSVGFTKYTCTTCGGSYTDNEVPKTGHSFETEDTEWQQGEENGKRIHYKECTNADCSLPNHKLVEYCEDFSRESLTPANCTTDGERVVVCSVCNYQLSREVLTHSGHVFETFTHSSGENGEAKHTQKCAVCQTEEEVACTFDGEGEIFESTCLEAGYTLHTCTACGYNYKDATTSLKNHDWGDDWHEEEGGWHVRHCSVGNHDEKHQENFLQQGARPADCTNGEEKYLTCQEENCTIEKTIAGAEATGHREATEYEYSQENGHQHKVYCSVCGTTIRYEACQISVVENPADCVNAGSRVTECAVCGYYNSEPIDALGHEWSAWSFDGEKHTKTCQRVGCEERREHDIVENVDLQSPTCTEDGTRTITCLHEEDGEQCTYSKTETIDKLGHKWQVDYSGLERNENTHKNAYCPVCSLVIEGEEAHEFSKNNFCDKCGWDGLTYTIKTDSTATLSSDKKVENVEEIIISDKTQDGHTITYVATNALARNTHVKKITFGANVEEISYSAAFGCSNLEEVVFNQGLKVIRSEAFMDCTKLGKLSVYEKTQAGDIEAKDGYVPSTITSIAATSFKNTAFMKNQANWETVIANEVEVGKAFYLRNQLLAVTLDDGKSSFEVKENTTSIGDNVFRGLTNLQMITLPASLTSIGADAFRDCDGLKYVVFKGDVDGWLNISFANDYSSPMPYAQALTIEIVKEDGDLTIDNNVSTIPAGCFRGDDLKKIVIPESVTSIGISAFENCELLADIEILGTLSYIGENAFKGTAFYNNDANWTDVMYTDGYLIKALYIGQHLIAVKEVQQAQKPANVEQTNTFSVAEGTKTIASGAFKNIKHLQNIVIVNSVSNIGVNAFVGCDNLTSLKFERTTGWMVWQEVIGRGRDLSNADVNATNAKTLFVGKWYWI